MSRVLRRASHSEDAQVAGSDAQGCRLYSRVAGTPGEHLIYEDAVGPPVHRLAVALGQDDLRREILWRAA